MGSTLSHLHLMVNANVDQSLSEIPRDRANDFINELMKITDMKPLGSLIWSNAEDLDFPGQSFVQMITTSHCSLHFFSDTHEIYFDLYSCKKFDPNKVMVSLKQHFGVEKFNGVIYGRNKKGDFSQIRS